MPLILVLKGLRQENLYEFLASLVFLSSRPAGATQQDSDSQRKRKKTDFFFFWQLGGGSLPPGAELEHWETSKPACTVIHCF